MVQLSHSICRIFNIVKYLSRFWTSGSWSLEGQQYDSDSETYVLPPVLSLSLLEARRACF